MSVGPSPAMNGTLATWPDTLMPRIIDANGDVNNFPPSSRPANRTPFAQMSAQPGPVSSGQSPDDITGVFIGLDSASSPGVWFSPYDDPATNGAAGAGASGTCGAPNGPPGGPPVGGPGGTGMCSGGADNASAAQGTCGVPTTGNVDLYPYYDGGCAALPCMPVNAFGNCVVPDTRIAMFPVGFKAASEVEIGDTVLSLAPNGEAAGELVAAIVHAFRHCVEVTLSNEQTLTCSLEHELMVGLGAGEPITHLKASELTGEHTLILQDGAHVPVLKVEIVGNRNVIRISLGGPNHVFFTDGVLSHNKATWPPL